MSQNQQIGRRVADPGPGPAHRASIRAVTLEALERLKALPPNWSGYGADPIDRRLIQAAKDFIEGSAGAMVEAPKVVPMTRGRLQLEWHRGNRSLELGFETADSIH